MGHDNIVNYNCEAFLAFVRKKFEIIACMLCMQIHILLVHQYHSRLVRSEVTEENIEIIIFSIYCPYAKAAGRQYTKRILPYFVIPECNICLINVFNFYTTCLPSGKINYSMSARTLGTVNVRTINRHYNMVRTYLLQANAEISYLLSTIPNLITLPDFKPGQNNEVKHLIHQIALINLSMEKAGMQNKTEPVRILHKVYIRQKFRKSSPEIPMNLVECSTIFNDTS